MPNRRSAVAQLSSASRVFYVADKKWKKLLSPHRQHIQVWASLNWSLLLPPYARQLSIKYHKLRLYPWSHYPNLGGNMYHLQTSFPRSSQLQTNPLGSTLFLCRRIFQNCKSTEGIAWYVQLSSPEWCTLIEHENNPSGRYMYPPTFCIVWTVLKITGWSF